jgi:large subunit ribosomal protein L19
MANVIDLIEREKARETPLDPFEVGNTIEVHVRIREGEKERIQKFIGVVIGIHGGGARKTFRVRRLVQGEGVERIFPYNSPNVAKIIVTRKGRVRRAKLSDLRDRVGRSTRLAERLDGRAPQGAAAAGAGAEATPSEA